MNRLEKLKKIQEAYYELVPGIKSICVKDYGLVLTDAPNYLKELIEEEKAAENMDESDRSDKTDKSGSGKAG